jgi:GNAT superfamily N-acetyltransferase
VYPPLFCVPLSLCVSWWRKELEIYKMVLNGEGKVIGYMNAIPITPSCKERLILGDFRTVEPEIRVSDIGGKDLYISSLAVHPEYWGSGVFRFLLSHARPDLLKYSTLLAWPASEKGKRLCTFCGFKEINSIYIYTINFNTKIYDLFI